MNCNNDNSIMLDLSIMILPIDIILDITARLPIYYIRAVICTSHDMRKCAQPIFDSISKHVNYNIASIPYHDSNMNLISDNCNTQLDKFVQLPISDQDIADKILCEHVHDDLSIPEWLIKCNTASLISALIIKNDIDMLRSVLQNNSCIKYDYKLSLYAVYYGKLDVLKWLNCAYRMVNPFGICETNPRMNNRHIDILAIAISRNYIDLVKFLTRSKSFIQSRDIFTIGDLAAQFGRLEILKWVMNIAPHKHSYAMICVKAAIGNHINIIKYILDINTGIDKQGLPVAKYIPDRTICECAARYGHFELLKWLRCDSSMFDSEYGRNTYGIFPWKNSTLYAAIECGRIDIIKYCLDNGLILSKGNKCCSRAAEYGQLEVLKWLRCDANSLDTAINSYGIAYWDEECITIAAGAGHLDMIKYMRDSSIHDDNICPWDSTATEFAANSNQLEVLMWLCTNGCPIECNICDISLQY